MHIPHTISEEPASPPSDEWDFSGNPIDQPQDNGHTPIVRVKRTPQALYKVPNENEPLLGAEAEDGTKAFKFERSESQDEESGSRIVTVAIYINLAANTVLLAGKIAVIVLTSSLSVLASLVDAALDFLSTAIVWTTTR